MKLLNDDKEYWCNQVEKANGRCYGIACDEKYILVSEYGDYSGSSSDDSDNVDAQVIILKMRQPKSK